MQFIDHRPSPRLYSPPYGCVPAGGPRVTSCAFCGRENEPESRFCIDCGKPMNPSAARVGPAYIPQPSGGQPQPANSPVAAPPRSPSSPLAPSAPSAPLVPPTRVSDAAANCPRCGKPATPGLPFCGHCGTLVGRRVSVEINSTDLRNGGGTQ